jgi:hypothetical protein
LALGRYGHGGLVALRAQVCAHKPTLAEAQTRIYALEVTHGYRRAASIK